MTSVMVAAEGEAKVEVAEAHLRWHPAVSGAEAEEVASLEAPVSPPTLPGLKKLPSSPVAQLPATCGALTASVYDPTRHDLQK